MRRDGKRVGIIDQTTSTTIIATKNGPRLIV